MRPTALAFKSVRLHRPRKLLGKRSMQDLNLLLTGHHCDPADDFLRVSPDLEAMMSHRGSDMDAQREYYDKRFAQLEFANLLQLQRCVAILEALQATGLREPRIIELGSGAGWLTSVLGSFGPSEGVELSPSAVEVAATRYSGSSPVSVPGPHPTRAKRDSCRA